MSKVSYHEYLIIGAGPAGLQMGYFLKQKMRDFLILEGQSKAGAFFEKFPRHNKLISINKVYTGYQDQEINLRWDWNSLLNDAAEPLLFKQFSQRYFPHSQAMLDYLAAFRERFDLPVQFDSKVGKIHWEAGQYHVSTSQGELRCRILIVATGVAREYQPALPGIEMAEKYSEVSVNPDDFRNQRVLIIGKGNSAFETADNLVDTAAMIHLVSPNPLKMAWFTHYVGHLRAVNNNLLDTYQLKSQNAILDATIEHIARDGEGFAVTFAYAHAQGEVETIHYDRLISCTGFAFDPAPFADCMPQTCINDRFPEQSAQWESTNQRNMFFAGTLMQMRDFKKQMSGFVHGFRYNVRTLHHLLEERFHGCAYPSQALPCDAESLGAAILERVNSTSSLWQQPGFLCDAITINRAQQAATLYPDLSLDLAKERMGHAEYLTVTLEFGTRKFMDPFGVARIKRDNAEHANESNFLHPVVRHFKDGIKLGEHHVLEDLAAEWLEPEHVLPLQTYLSRLLEAARFEAQTIHQAN